MAVTHSVNGIEFDGIQANWVDQVVQNKLDNTATLSELPLHTWSTAFMNLEKFFALQALMNVDIIELKTNQYQDRNAQGTYTTVKMDSPVNGDRWGNRVNNVSVTFRVKK